MPRSRSWLVPDRRSDPELMDAPGLPAEEVADAYAVLRRVNRHLGNNRVIDREVARFRTEDPIGTTVSLLDVGSGSGDIPRRITRLLDHLGLDRLVPIALDRDPVATSIAGSSSFEGPPVHVVRGDALRLPFSDHSVDLVTAVKFAHHFEGKALARLLSEMARVARCRVVVLDIRRHWLAYWGFVAWSRVFTRNRLVRFDGPLSVLRGFTDHELTELAATIDGFQWSVRRNLGFQISLIGKRK
ncbi:methyltransferase domain-containing protein [Tautonia rosea]|uniref:methyltransferase domain-containing protein n=1 Tax=Tautonia rosea TaxID=2728037 RepID=UPI001473D2DD|nr:methyltransferase domain-containing protein [Tautonia rosea]